MIPRSAKYLVLALLIVGCGRDQSILEPQAVPTAAASASMADGRTITSVTINGSAPPATLNAVSNQALAFVVRGFTTLDQIIPTWLSTSVQFTPNPSGSLTFRCDEIDVWNQMMPGSNLMVSFSATAPADTGTYLVTVRAHQQDGCTAVFPSAPFPSGPDQFILHVTPAQTPPVLAQIGNKNVDELSTLSFNATATDNDVPAQTLTFSLANPASGTFPAGATISSSGAFSWMPNEAQGPGTYRVKVVVSDGTFTDDEEIEITVNEVNNAPELTVPGTMSTQWGVSLPNAVATATDSDQPPNVLTFSKVSGPSWVTVDPAGGITFGSIAANDVGSHTVLVRVTDNGTPAQSDEESFTVNVANRPSMLAYTGRTSGQYSDESVLNTMLVDDGAGALNGTAIANATINFSVDGAPAGSGVTAATGLASVNYSVSQAAGSYVVGASFAGGAGYVNSSATAQFTVNREDAVLAAPFPASFSLGTGDLIVTVSAREELVSGAEPTPNDGAHPGDIGNVAAVTATIRGTTSNAVIQASCGAGSGGSPSYGSSESFTCTFAAAALVADQFTFEVVLPASDAYYRAATLQGSFVITNPPQAANATGEGSFQFDGDKVTFSMGANATESKFIIVRHLAAGGACKLKSGLMNPATAVGNRVTLSGKGTYSCSSSVDDTPGVEVDVVLVAEDNGSPGTGRDRIWVTNSGTDPDNKLQMPQPPTTNAALLTGGNITLETVTGLTRVRRGSR